MTRTCRGKLFTQMVVIFLFLAGPSLSQAANVAFFNDPAYVDVAQEALNLRTTLVSAGHTVTDINGHALADFTTGLTGADILVIPELQNGDLFAGLDAATRTLIQTFVNNGGTLQIHGGTPPNDVNFLNGIFGYALVTNGTLFAGSSTLTVAAASTQFATAPASVTNNSAVTQVSMAGLPAGATCIYTPDAGTNCVLFVVDYGAGEVIFMGWDWYNAPPQGAADGGWLSVANLISVAAGGGAVTTTGVPSLSQWGVLLLSGLLLAAVFVQRRRQGS